MHDDDGEASPSSDSKEHDATRLLLTEIGKEECDASVVQQALAAKADPCAIDPLVRTRDQRCTGTETH